MSFIGLMVIGVRQVVNSPKFFDYLDFKGCQFLEKLVHYFGVVYLSPLPLFAEFPGLCLKFSIGSNFKIPKFNFIKFDFKVFDALPKDAHSRLYFNVGFLFSILSLRLQRHPRQCGTSF